jgi:enoyl-CoA hydratase/carnithine racemase
MPYNFLIEKKGLITTITFNRPDRRNCVNRDVLNELEGLIRSVRDDRGVRVLIMTGTGASFCAGADTSTAKGIDDPQERRRIFGERNAGVPRMIGRTFDQITRLDCITICAVNGHAVGGGWALASAFDFVLAAESAEFWVPEVELGAPFAGGPAIAMAARMGPWRAKEAMVLCRRYSARELLAIGMVNRVVAGDRLIAAAHELADAVVKMPERAVRATKHFVDGIFIGPRLY